LIHMCKCNVAAKKSNVNEMWLVKNNKKYTLFLRQCKVNQPA
jgi:hypothetical protein